MARRLHDLTENSERLRALHDSRGIDQHPSKETVPPPPTVDGIRVGIFGGVNWARTRALLWLFGLAIVSVPAIFMVPIKLLVVAIPIWCAVLLAAFLTVSWTYPQIVSASPRDILDADIVAQIAAERREAGRKAIPTFAALTIVLLVVAVAAAASVSHAAALGRASPNTLSPTNPHAPNPEASAQIAQAALSQQQFHDQATLLLTMDLELRFCANAWPEFQPSFGAAETLLDATWQQASDQNYDIADLRAARDEQRSQSEGLIRNGLVPAGTQSDFITCQGAAQWVEQPNRSQ